MSAPSESASALREVVDFDVLGAWMDAQGLPRGCFERIEPLTGGTQNILIRFSRADRDYVLRRPPLHLRPKSNEALRREARVLAALATTDVPHPALIAACLDEQVMGGAVFYLMEPVAGFNATTALPALHASDERIRHAMGLHAADAVACLGRIDYVAAGLGDLGRPQGFLERQVERWLSELGSYARFAGYPGPNIPGVDAVARWIDDNRPRTWTPGILHGDYHLANLMYAYDGPEVVAIVDWEMCTIGDPLLDLGWLLATWPDAEAGFLGPSAALAVAGGLPTRDEIAARYAEGSSRNLSAIAWYTVLACFKLGIVLEGTHARAHAGLAARATGDLLHAWTLALFRRAAAIIAAS